MSCSDLVDVVIDVSCIYGVNVKEAKDGSEKQIETIPYDDDSTAAIRLGSGMVLYLREVSSYLALVCIIREEYFAKRALLDYNIGCFKQSLEKICNIKEE